MRASRFAQQVSEYREQIKAAKTFCETKRTRDEEFVTRISNELRTLKHEVEVARKSKAALELELLSVKEEVKQQQVVKTFDVTEQKMEKEKIQANYEQKLVDLRDSLASSKDEIQDLKTLQLTSRAETLRLESLKQAVKLREEEVLCLSACASGSNDASGAALQRAQDAAAAAEAARCQTVVEAAALRRELQDAVSENHKWRQLAKDFISHGPPTPEGLRATVLLMMTTSQATQHHRTTADRKVEEFLLENSKLKTDLQRLKVDLEASRAEGESSNLAAAAARTAAETAQAEIELLNAKLLASQWLPSRTPTSSTSFTSPTSSASQGASISALEARTNQKEQQEMELAKKRAVHDAALIQTLKDKLTAASSAGSVAVAELADVRHRMENLQKLYGDLESAGSRLTEELEMSKMLLRDARSERDHTLRLLDEAKKQTAAAPVGACTSSSAASSTPACSSSASPSPACSSPSSSSSSSSCSSSSALLSAENASLVRKLRSLRSFYVKHLSRLRQIVAVTLGWRVSHLQERSSGRSRWTFECTYANHRGTVEVLTVERDEGAAEVPAKLLTAEPNGTAPKMEDQAQPPQINKRKRNTQELDTEHQPLVMHPNRETTPFTQPHQQQQQQQMQVTSDANDEGKHAATATGQPIAPSTKEQASSACSSSFVVREAHEASDWTIQLVRDYQPMADVDETLKGLSSSRLWPLWMARLCTDELDRLRAQFAGRKLAHNIHGELINLVDS
eukprot:GHVT01065544.1.p1 GENE.GHVT01065544.1~~GHVT01065544.1.p1  ORF type:complete len:740 (-),score=210.31 GHVT01065544.1:899-3118(-)